MRNWYGLLFALLFSFTPQLSFAEDGLKIHMACGHFPPFKIKNDKIRGIDTEIMVAAFAQSNRQVDFRFYPWKRAFFLVKEGRANGLCGCSFRKEREALFVYSDIMGHLSQGVFVKSSYKGQNIRKVEDLKDMSVATVSGYAVQKELEKYDVNNTGVIDDIELLKLLLNDRVDAIYAYRDVIRYGLKQKGKADQVTYFEISSQPYYGCFSRALPQSQEIVQDLNYGLRVIRQNGTYQKIWDNYLASK